MSTALPSSSSSAVPVPAGDDHPLAAGALADARTTTPSASDASAAASASRARSLSPASPPPPPPPPRRKPSPAPAPAVSPSSNSLDTLADDFLSADSCSLSHTHTQSSAPILRPNPLPRGETKVSRLRTLVERRAWGDVLKVAFGLLDNDRASAFVGASRKPPKSELHSAIYASLLFAERFGEGQGEGEGEGQTINHHNLDDHALVQARLETAEIMVLQCHAWLKLRRYADLSAEVKRWKFLKQNDVHAEPIEWLPWGIHILAAQSLEYSEETAAQSTDVLCHLREDIPTSEHGWLASLDSALANTYLRRGNWRLAIGALERVLDLIPEAASSEVEYQYVRASNSNFISEKELAAFLRRAYSSEILSRQGRIFLQMGGMSEATECFQRAAGVWNEGENRNDNQAFIGSHPLSDDALRVRSLRATTRAQIELNTGLVRFSESDYDAALESFSAAAQEILSGVGHGNTNTNNNNNTSQPPAALSRSIYRPRDWVGPAAAGAQQPSLLYHEAINNASLCHLYSCRLADAVSTLEALVRNDPAAFLTERTAFNLCTLYELGSDSVVATRNKRVLQLIAKRFFLHDVGPESFRVT